MFYSLIVSKFIGLHLTVSFARFYITAFSTLAPDCGQPPSPGLRGVVSYNSTLFEAVAVYSCEVGYSLEPSEGGTRLCQLSGRWSGVDPVCISEYSVFQL